MPKSPSLRRSTSSLHTMPFWIGAMALAVLLTTPALADDQKAPEASRTDDAPKQPAEAAKPADAKRAAPVSKDADAPLPPVATKRKPTGASDLIAIQESVQKVVEKAIPATVSLIVRGGNGSGVIVSKDGYILTAAHVSGEPGKPVTVIMHDGRRVRGVTLGAHMAFDAGMAKITQPGDWPYVELGKSGQVPLGAWCVATGHPDGYQKDRPPVVRVGRLLGRRANMLWSDCTLVSGDSGGPLFDLNGHVIGIHSRIGPPIVANIHVEADIFTKYWDQFLNRELIKDPGEDNKRPFFGVQAVDFDEDDTTGARIIEVVPGSTAQRAGVRLGDVITEFDGEEVKNARDLAEKIGKKKIGDRIVLEVRRAGRPLSLRVRLRGR